MAFRTLLSKIPKTISTTTNHQLLRQMTTKPFGSEQAQYIWISNNAMKRGPKCFMDSWVTDKGFFGWILLPGVPKESVTVKVIGDKVHFEGHEDPDLRGYPYDKEDIVRKYDGFLYVDTAKLDPTRVKIELVDGIFWFHVPLVSQDN